MAGLNSPTARSLREAFAAEGTGDAAKAAPSTAAAMAAGVASGAAAISTGMTGATIACAFMIWGVWESEIALPGVRRTASTRQDANRAFLRRYVPSRSGWRWNTI